MKHGFCSYKYRSLLITASFSALVEYIIIFTDKLIIGNTLGEIAFSVTDMITPLFSLSLFISSIIAGEVSAAHSFYMGRFEKNRATEIFSIGVIMSVFAGILMLMIALLGRLIYFDFLGLSKELLEFADPYYKYYQFSVLFYPAYTLLSKSIYSDGDEKIYIASVIARVFFNAVISYLLCKSIGIAGASIGTLISTIISFLILPVHFLSKRNSLVFKMFFSVKDMLNILRSGLPYAINHLYQAIFTFVLSKYIIAYIGEKFLSVLSVVTAVLAVAAIFNAVTQAVEPLCYVYFGEGNQMQIRKVMRMASKTAITFGVSATLFFMAFSHIIISSLDLTNTEIIEMSKKAILIVSPSLVFMSLFALLITYYKILGKDITFIFASSLRELVIPLSIAIPLSLLIGIEGVWIGLSISPLVTILFCIFGIHRQRTIKHISLIPESHENVIYRTFDLVLSPESIIEVRNGAEKLLIQNGIRSSTVNYIKLMIEEVFMLVLEKNADTKVYAECSVRIDDDDVQLILRDSGMIFNVTDSDMDVTSMQVYIVSRIMNKQEEKIHHVTTSYNRNAFRFAK